MARKIEPDGKKNGVQNQWNCFFRGNENLGKRIRKIRNFIRGRIKSLRNLGWIRKKGILIKRRFRKSEKQN